ncbi:MAG: hypothetical protein HY810_08585 [Candidatus Omnitrophica bacterium]|nr:hypothetical protein [Candidatus Omnitrophota bacterium]
MIEKFLSEFINLDKYALGFWNPFRARELSELLLAISPEASSAAPKTWRRFVGFAIFGQKNLC